MSMLLFIPHELWSIIDDSGSVVSSVVSSHPTLLSFHMLAGNVDRALFALSTDRVRDSVAVLHEPTLLPPHSQEHTMRLTQHEQTSPLFLGKDARRHDR